MADDPYGLWEREEDVKRDVRQIRGFSNQTGKSHQPSIVPSSLERDDNMRYSGHRERKRSPRKSNGRVHCQDLELHSHPSRKMHSRSRSLAHWDMHRTYQQPTQNDEPHKDADWRAKHLSVAIENIPWDMDWLELKNIGRLFGFAHARTVKTPGSHVGFLEFSSEESVRKAFDGLEGCMVQGCKHPLRVRQVVLPDTLLLRGSEGLRKSRNW